MRGMAAVDCGRLEKYGERTAAVPGKKVLFMTIGICYNEDETDDPKRQNPF